MSDDTYQNFRERLLSNEFEPGSRLSPELLCKDYGISASAMRELLLRLTAVRLVDFFKQRGFRMPEQSLQLQHDLTQTRIMLETEGACRSIRFGNIAWEALLNAAHHELKHIEVRIRQSLKPKELLLLWAAAELKFHRTLIAACQSEVLLDLHLQVYHRFRQQLIISDKNFVYIALNVNQHQNILDAVLNRDEARVRQSVHEHLARHLLP